VENYLGFEYFFDANKRIYYIYIISSFLLAFIYLLLNPKDKRVNFSSKLWLHKSAQVDYIYFFMANLIKISLIFPLLLSSKTVALATVLFLSDNFGYQRINMSYEMVLALFTFTVFIVSDFTRYCLHRLLHTIPLLWNFHKVHHSAKVLTPMTFYRVHPIENVLFGLRYVLSIGCVSGIFIYFFGAKVGLYEIIGVNAFVFIFSLLGGNLRHSHVKFFYPKILEKVLISPYMHQIHHSKKHFNKNFGGSLAIWDYLFRTHLFSHEVKNIKFGLRKDQMKEYDSALKLLIIPFKMSKKATHNDNINNN